MSSWRDYIGLPHEIGADPCIGAAADCLLTVFAVQDELGIVHPETDERWFDLARRDAWRELVKIFFEYAYVVDDPGDGDFTMMMQEKHKIAMSVMIDDGALTVSEKRGVIWVPPPLLQPWNIWYQWAR